MSQKKQKGNIQHENCKLKVLMIKQILRSEQRGRDLEGALFDTCIGPAEDAMVEKMTSQNQLYAKATKEAKGHGLGPPHVWTFGGLLGGLIEKGDAVGGQNLAVLKRYYGEYDGLSTEEKCDMVRFCRLTKVFNKTQKRITICIRERHSDLRVAMLAALTQTDWSRKHGRAPPSHMERELQAWLEVLLGE